MKLHLDLSDSCGSARRGSVTTARGTFQTPVFMPVATRGAIRSLATHQMASIATKHGAQIEVVLGNTYHLMQRPGADTVEALGGLHGFTGWGDRHMLTDSGGFQVFSLSPKVSDDGAEFRSTYDGSKILLTPESAVRIQEQLGADIQMVLDVCAGLPATQAVLRSAVERTAQWAARAKRAHARTADQSLFGIVQGGDNLDLRRESALRTVEIDFDGYAIGGLSVGETREQMMESLESAIAELPADQPRYLMGVGDPLSIIEAVARGVDMFDCVLPTRLARHGTLLTDNGRLNIKRSEFADDDSPVSSNCTCETCLNYPRGLLRHLISQGELTGQILATIHNLTWILSFVEDIRSAISGGTLDVMRAEVAQNWASMSPERKDVG